MATRRRGRPAHPDVLTPAEWAILNLYRHGLARGVIAQRRGMSGYGVRYHLRNISSKLGSASVRELRQWPGYPAGSPISTRSRRTRSHGFMDSELSLGPLAQVSLLCRSVEQTEAWYRDVLRLPHVFTFGDLVFFDCGGTRLFIRQVDAAAFQPSSILYFSVDDMTTAVQALTARGVQFSGAPHMIFKDPGTGVEEWFAFFNDPDGNILALLARVAA